MPGAVWSGSAQDASPQPCSPGLPSNDATGMGPRPQHNSPPCGLCISQFAPTLTTTTFITTWGDQRQKLYSTYTSKQCMPQMPHLHRHVLHGSQPCRSAAIDAYTPLGLVQCHMATSRYRNSCTIWTGWSADYIINSTYIFTRKIIIVMPHAHPHIHPRTRAEDLHADQPHRHKAVMRLCNACRSASAT